MKTIELHLKAVDFKGTDYISNCHCAVSKAVKRQLNVSDVEEVVLYVIIKDQMYGHAEYSYADYSVDFKQATSAGFDNTTIRTITLTKAN